MVRINSKSRRFGGPRRWLGVSLALAMLMAMSASANAASILIGSFTPVSGQYVWTNNNPSQSGSLTSNGSTAAQVLFTFTAASGQPTTTHSATVILTAFASGAALSPSDQPINNPSTLSIVDNVTHTTLLTVSFTGDLIALGSPASAAQLSATNATYASPGLGAGFFNILFPAVTPNIVLTNGVFSSFSADGSAGAGTVTGQFFINGPVVPEPASIAMLGTGVVAVGFLSLRRKRLARLNRAQAVA